jgi:O-succinylbenzoic acid--CoA ligase
VPLTCGNHRASAEASAANLGVRPDDDWLCPLPLAHVGGLAVVLRAVLYGTCVTLVEGFAPEAVARHLRSGAVTHASLVPTMLRRLLEASPGDTPLGSERLRAVLLGGGPVDPELVERALARGLPVLGTYGMTETASQVATVPPASAAGKPGAAGPALPGVEIELRDVGGRALPPGETGEIHVRGPMVAAALVRPEGWLATGDLGRLDGDGWLWVEGRREGLVVTGGENVSAAEVEAVLRAHPAVADCAVVGLPDPEWGELVAAAVVPRGPAAPPAAEALAAWCRARLAPFKVPKRWRIVEELPRTGSGKTARAALKALFD